jgi:hypothetical protein
MGCACCTQALAGERAPAALAHRPNSAGGRVGGNLNRGARGKDGPRRNAAASGRRELHGGSRSRRRLRPLRYSQNCGCFGHPSPPPCRRRRVVATKTTDLAWRSQISLNVHSCGGGHQQEAEPICASRERLPPPTRSQCSLTALRSRMVVGSTERLERKTAPICDALWSCVDGQATTALKAQEAAPAASATQGRGWRRRRPPQRRQPGEPRLCATDRPARASCAEGTRRHRWTRGPAPFS